MKQFLIVGVLSAWSVAHDAANVGVLLTANRISKATATVDTVPGKPLVIVHLTNLSTVPLEAWQITLDYDRGSGTRSALDVTTDTALADSDFPGSGPIQPGATMDKTVALAAVPVSVTVSIRMLLFADLSSEGSSEEVAFVLRERERHADTLATWIDLLKALAGKPPQQCKTALQRAVAAEDRRIDPSDSFALAIRDRMAQLIAHADSDTNAMFGKRIAAIKQEYESQRGRALRHKSR